MEVACYHEMISEASNESGVGDKFTTAASNKADPALEEWCGVSEMSSVFYPSGRAAFTLAKEGNGEGDSSNVRAETSESCAWCVWPSTFHICSDSAVVTYSEGKAPLMEHAEEGIPSEVASFAVPHNKSELPSVDRQLFAFEVRGPVPCLEGCPGVGNVPLLGDNAWTFGWAKFGTLGCLGTLLYFR